LKFFELPSIPVDNYISFVRRCKTREGNVPQAEKTSPQVPEQLQSADQPGILAGLPWIQVLLLGYERLPRPLKEPSTPICSLPQPPGLGFVSTWQVPTEGLMTNSKQPFWSDNLSFPWLLEGFLQGSCVSSWSASSQQGEWRGGDSAKSAVSIASMLFHPTFNCAN
jgi:hypothetical protein